MGHRRAARHLLAPGPRARPATSGARGRWSDLVTEAAAGITPVEVGIADGLFAAVLAARRRPGRPGRGAPPRSWPPSRWASSASPELAELLDRLGIRTLGDFAALPESHVLGRFGADGALCHRVAGGRSGELAELRQPGRPAGGSTDQRTGSRRRWPEPGSGVLGRGERRRCPGRPGPGRRAGPPRARTAW